MFDTLAGALMAALGGLTLVLGLWQASGLAGYVVRVVRLHTGSPTPVDRVDGADDRVDVTGIAHGESVRAPFSGVPALACEYETRHPDGTVVAEGAVGGAFELAGEGRSLRVDADELPLVATERIALTADPDEGLPAAVEQRVDDLPPGFDPANATRPREYIERRIEPGARVRVVGRLDGDRVVPSEDGTEQVVRDGDPETELRSAVVTLAGVLVSFVLVGTLLLAFGLAWALGLYRP